MQWGPPARPFGGPIRPIVRGGERSPGDASGHVELPVGLPRLLVGGPPSLPVSGQIIGGGEC
jgi:hypothetical protein